LSVKREIEIKIPSVIRSIPFIAPPACLAVNFIRFIGGVKGYNLFFAEIASVAVEVSFIAKSKPSHLAAVRTESGRRDGLFFTRENRRNLIVEGKVFRGDFVVGCTLAAGFLHGLLLRQPTFEVSRQIANNRFRNKRSQGDRASTVSGWVFCIWRRCGQKACAGDVFSCAPFACIRGNSPGLAI